MDNQILQNNKIVAAQLTVIAVRLLEKVKDVDLITTRSDDLKNKQQVYDIIENVLFVHRRIEEEPGENPTQTLILFPRISFILITSNGESLKTFFNAATISIVFSKQSS